MSPYTKALIGAFSLTAISVASQLARGQDLSAQPEPAQISISHPFIMRVKEAILIVDCSIPKTYLTLPRGDGGADYYTFGTIPTIDATPSSGQTPSLEERKAHLTQMMMELGQRQIDDFSLDTLCRDGRPNVGAAAAIMNFATNGAREFDI